MAAAKNFGGLAAMLTSVGLLPEAEAKTTVPQMVALSHQISSLVLQITNN